jgi:hypothetical protein
LRLREKKSVSVPAWLALPEANMKRLSVRFSAVCGRTAVAGGIALGCAGDARERRVTTESWDTVAIWGGTSAEDTTFHQPVRLVLWKDLVVVVDGTSPHLRVFDKEGRRLWAFGRTGEGPGEFQQISMLDIAENGNLLVLDPNARKVIEFAADGTLLKETVFDATIRVGTEFLQLRDKFVLISSDPLRSVIELDGSDYHHIRSMPLPFPDSVPRRAILSRWNARISQDGGDWVSAFQIGPGFFVHRTDSVEFHPYVEDVPFLVVGRGGTENPDSLRNAANSLDVVGEEIYMLFGGSRGSRLNPERRPPEYVDIYGLDGRYRRSLRMPLAAFTLKTDGELFYALQFDPVPALVILRPK